MNRVFLPMVQTVPAVKPLEIGMQMTVNASARPYIRATGMKYIVMNNWRWSAFADPTSSELEGLVAECNAIVAEGAMPIAIVHGWPSWASDAPCIPPGPKYIPQFLEFLDWMVRATPIKYYQIMQEPDLRDGMVGYFGCWGEQYFETYIAYLRESYTFLHSRIPDCKVIIGLSELADFYARIKDYPCFDVLSVHRYKKYPLDTSPIFQSVNIDKTYWIGECNLTGGGEGFHKAQGIFLWKAAEEARRVGAQALMFYGWNNDWKPGSDIRDNPYAKDTLSLITKLYA